MLRPPSDRGPKSIAPWNHATSLPRDSIRDTRASIARPVRLVDVVETAAVEHFLDVRLRERRADREPRRQARRPALEPNIAAPSASPNGPGTGATRNAPSRRLHGADDRGRLEQAAAGDHAFTVAGVGDDVAGNLREACDQARGQSAPHVPDLDVDGRGIGERPGRLGSGPTRPFRREPDADTSIVPSR